MKQQQTYLQLVIQGEIRHGNGVVRAVGVWEKKRTPGWFSFSLCWLSSILLHTKPFTRLVRWKRLPVGSSGEKYVLSGIILRLGLEGRLLFLLPCKGTQGTFYHLASQPQLRMTIGHIWRQRPHSAEENANDLGGLLEISWLAAPIGRIPAALVEL